MEVVEVDSKEVLHPKNAASNERIWINGNNGADYCKFNNNLVRYIYVNNSLMYIPMNYIPLKFTISFNCRQYTIALSGQSFNGTNNFGTLKNIEVSHNSSTALVMNSKVTVEVTSFSLIINYGNKDKTYTSFNVEQQHAGGRATIQASNAILKSGSVFNLKIKTQYGEEYTQTLTTSGDITLGTDSYKYGTTNKVVTNSYNTVQITL